MKVVDGHFQQASLSELLNEAEDKICNICNVLILEHNVDHRAIAGMLNCINIVEIDRDGEEV